MAANWLSGCTGIPVCYVLRARYKPVNNAKTSSVQ